MKILRFDRTMPETIRLANVVISVDQSDTFYIHASFLGFVKGTVKSLSEDGLEYDFAITEQGAFLLVGEASYHIISGDLDQPVKKIIPLSRSNIDDSDYFRQQFVEINDGVLFVYESGIIRFDAQLEVGWQHHHRRLDWFFVQTHNDEVIYESEHEHEGRWTYSLATGVKSI